MTFKWWELNNFFDLARSQDILSVSYKVTIADIRTTVQATQSALAQLKGATTPNTMSLAAALAASRTRKVASAALQPSIFAAQAYSVSSIMKLVYSVDVIETACDGWEPGYYVLYGLRYQQIETLAELELILLFEQLVRVDDGWHPLPINTDVSTD